MTDEPTHVYSAGLSFDYKPFGDLTLAQWMDRVEKCLAQLSDRPACPVNRSTLHADVLASAVLAMRNVEDVESNVGELARQVHGALQHTYERWMQQPPPEPYFRSRLLERTPSVGQAYLCSFDKLGREQRDIIESLVEAFLDAYHASRATEQASVATDSGALI